MKGFQQPCPPGSPGWAAGASWSKGSSPEALGRTGQECGPPSRPGGVEASGPREAPQEQVLLKGDQGGKLAPGDPLGLRLLPWARAGRGVEQREVGVLEGARSCETR